MNMKRFEILTSISLAALLLLTAFAPAAAPATISYLHVSYVLGPGQSGAFQANCPAGSAVTGGGVDLGPDIRWYGSTPSGSGWRALAHNTSGANQHLDVYAACLSGVRAKSVVAKDAATVPAGGFASASVKCPAGTLASGGGFATGDNDHLHVAVTRLEGNGWLAAAYNHGKQDEVLRVYANCLKGVKGQAELSKDSETSSNVVPTTAAPGCKAPALLSAGGFRLPDELEAFLYFPFIGPGGNWLWETTVWDYPGPGLGFHGYGVCLTIY